MEKLKVTLTLLSNIKGPKAIVTELEKAYNEL